MLLENTMKKVFAAAALAFAAQGALAGGYEEPVYTAPVMAPVVVEEAAHNSSANTAGIVLALTTLIILGVGAAGN